MVGCDRIDYEELFKGRKDLAVTTSRSVLKLNDFNAVMSKTTINASVQMDGWMGA